MDKHSLLIELEKISIIQELIKTCEELFDNACLFNHEKDIVWVHLKKKSIKTINKAKRILG